MPTMVGKVTRERYDELVAQSKVLVETERDTHFKLGDNALEIEPLQMQGACTACGGGGCSDGRGDPGAVRG